MKKLLIMLLLVSCNIKSNVAELAPIDFDAKIKSSEGAILIDVRTEHEYNQGKIPGAVNYIYGVNFGNKTANLEKKPIFLYCHTGGRAAMAAKDLQKKGYEVYSLKGGFKAWEEAGKPFE